MKRLLVISVFALLLITLAGIALAESERPVPTLYSAESNYSGNRNVACTMDAKMCPDGSYVGRTGPNCEFAPCPTANATCVCPSGYIQEGETCTPKCYYSTPRCMMPSIICNSIASNYTNENITHERTAYIIAQQICSSFGKVYANGNYNSNSQTWWFDLIPKEKREGCYPACVVSLSDKTAEVNWRCTGAILENETETPIEKPRILGVENNVNKTERCQEWGCTKWAACINETQTRQCTKIADCLNQTNEQVTPKLTKDCHEKERIIQHNNSFECPENCVCSGSTVKCEFEGGRTMTVYAGNSGNIIVQIKNLNMSTNVTLYKEDGKVYGVFRGNDTKEIHLPDEVKDNLQNHTRTKLYNESINLTDEGYYKIEGKKKSKLFWLFPVKEHVRAEMNASTGQPIKIRNPWWGFLAKDVREKGNSSSTQ